MSDTSTIRQAIADRRREIEALELALSILDGSPAAPSAPPVTPKGKSERVKASPAPVSPGKAQAPSGTKPPRGLAGTNVAKVLIALQKDPLLTTEGLMKSTGLSRDEIVAVCRNHSERLQRNQKGKHDSPYQLTEQGKKDAAALGPAWDRP